MAFSTQTHLIVHLALVLAQLDLHLLDADTASLTIQKYDEETTAEETHQLVEIVHSKRSLTWK